MTSEQYLADIIGIGMGVDRMQLTVDLPEGLKVPCSLPHHAFNLPLLFIFHLLCCAALPCVQSPCVADVT